MRRTVLYGAALALVGFTTNFAPAQETRAAPNIRAPFAHVCVFRMKPDAPKDAVAKAIADCRNLLSGIPSVRSVHAGRPAKQGTPDVPKMEYDFALIVLVDDAAGLKAYLEHPKHLEYVEKHVKHFDMKKLEVFDFINQSK
ncbi:MAG TPA: Dabb family protein [Gemmataceae bacterium]|nr:Dabb family protein [Gemmataceae bacterium]